MRIRGDYVRLFVLALVLGLLAAAKPVCGRSGRKVTKLADGVYEIQHEPTGNIYQQEADFRGRYLPSTLPLVLLRLAIPRRVLLNEAWPSFVYLGFCQSRQRRRSTHEISGSDQSGG
jgi:hypothetical protein